MNRFVGACRMAAGWMEFLGGSLVFLMMLLTVTDVTLRYFDRPILGSYELICLMGAAVTGLTMPKTSLERGHVAVDLLLARRSHTTRVLCAAFTRLLAVALFAALTWFLVLKGIESRESGLVTSILQIPQHYLVCGLAFCAGVQILALIADFASHRDRADKP